MRRFGSAFAWAAASIVVFAGVACACDVPTAQVRHGPDAQHAHHHDAHDRAGSCEHAAGCADCAPDATPIERLTGLAPASALAPDDIEAADATERAAAHRHRIHSRHPPPLPQPRAAQTPVHRFDVLLN